MKWLLSSNKTPNKVWKSCLVSPSLRPLQPHALFAKQREISGVFTWGRFPMAVVFLFLHTYTHTHTHTYTQQTHTDAHTHTHTHTQTNTHRCTDTDIGMQYTHTHLFGCSTMDFNRGLGISGS